jgi:hypothetical protein
MMINLIDAERTAYRELLVARDEETRCRLLESSIFEAYLASSKATSLAAARENVAFDAWCAASKALEATSGAANDS